MYSNVINLGIEISGFVGCGKVCGSGLVLKHVGRAGLGLKIAVCSFFLL